MTAGGGNANTLALRIFENFSMARPTTAFTFRSARRRRSQSLSMTNPSPTFCPVPEKPLPASVKQESTASFSSTRKWFRTWSMTCSVCSRVEPEGSVTWMYIMP